MEGGICPVIVGEKIKLFKLSKRSNLYWYFAIEIVA